MLNSWTVTKEKNQLGISEKADKSAFSHRADDTCVLGPSHLLDIMGKGDWIKSSFSLSNLICPCHVPDTSCTM